MKKQTKKKKKPIISSKFKRWLIRRFHLEDELSAEIIAKARPEIIAEIDAYKLLAERLGMTEEQTITEVLWDDSPEDYPNFCEPVKITTTIYVRNGERYAKTLFGYVHVIRWNLNVKLRKLNHKFHVLADDYKIIEYKNRKLKERVPVLEQENERLQEELDAQKIKVIESEPQEAPVQLIITHKQSDELEKVKHLLWLSQQNCANVQLKLTNMQNKATDNMSRKRCSKLLAILNSEQSPNIIIAQAKKYLLHKEDCGEVKMKKRHRNKKI